MFASISDRACLIPFYEADAATNLCVTSPCYEDDNGICNPNLTPSRGCHPPFLATSDPGVFTDSSGPCNPEFSQDEWFTVAPTPGTKPAFDSKFILYGMAGLLVLTLLTGKRRRR